MQALGRRWACAECAGGRAWARAQAWALGTGRSARVRRQLGGRRARQGAAGVGSRGARRGRARRAAWAWPGRWVRGLDALAGRGCALGALGRFWPGLTQYFPESNFLDSVREPGS